MRDLTSVEMAAENRRRHDPQSFARLEEIKREHARRRDETLLTLTITTPKGQSIHPNRSQSEVNRMISDWSVWLDQCVAVSIRFDVREA